MITKLAIRDFCGIAEGEIHDCSQVNILIGPNNSGKTTILEALYLAATADMGCLLHYNENPSEHAAGAGESTVFPVAISNTHDMHTLNPIARIWQRHNCPQRWQDAPAQWGDGEIHFSGLPDPLSTCTTLQAPEHSTKRFDAGDEHVLTMMRFQQTEPHNDLPVHSLPSFVREYWNVAELSEESMAMPTIPNSSYTFSWYPNFTHTKYTDEMDDNTARVASWAVESKLPLPAAKNTLLLDIHTNQAHFTQAFVERGEKLGNEEQEEQDIDNEGVECGDEERINDYVEPNNHWQQRIAKSFAKIFDLPRNAKTQISFQPHPYMQDYCETFIERDGKKTSLDTWGSGAQHVVKILAPLIMLSETASVEDPGIVLWEDAEMALHPHIATKLMCEVLTIIKNKPIQLFITTHSIELVASLTDLVRSMRKRKRSFSNIIRAFRLRIDDGKLIASRFAYDHLTTWLDGGLDPRFWNQGDRFFEYEEYRSTTMKRKR